VTPLEGDRVAALRILALGDSYTIGEGVAPDDRWPIRLATLLRACGMIVDEPIVVARTGWTTDELFDGIDAVRPPGSYGLVTLLIGVNNQYRARSADEYRMQFRALLVRAISFADAKASHVIVVSIPDWSVTPFAEGRDRARIASEINAFNAINRDETERAGARYVDITPISRDAEKKMSLVASDGLHPSAQMYEEWVMLILPVAVRALGG
jgi:lysophospholipase L1-like esterase